MDELTTTTKNAPQAEEPKTNYSPLEIGSIGRNRKGQFLTGSIPNPKGRPLGSRNRASLLARALLEERAAEITQKVMEEALAGNPIAYKLCIERLVPIPQDAPVDLRLPETGASHSKNTPARMFESHNALLKAVGEGDITPQEAQSVSSLLEARRRSWEVLELHQRLEQIEDDLAANRKGK